MAEQSGTVIVRQPQNLIGTYVTSGDEIVSIGDEAKKELRVVIDQEDVKAFTAHVGQPLSIRLSGDQKRQHTLTRVPPKASLDPPHESLFAPHGGPLQVRQKDSADSEGPEDKYELVTPAFTGIVDLAQEAGSELRAGQRGVVWLAGGRESIARHVGRLLRECIPETFARQFNLAP